MFGDQEALRQYAGCSLRTRRRSYVTLDSRYVLNMSWVCSSNVLDMFSVCFRYVLDVSRWSLCRKGRGASVVASMVAAVVAPTSPHHRRGGCDPDAIFAYAIAAIGLACWLASSIHCVFASVFVASVAQMA